MVGDSGSEIQPDAPGTSQNSTGAQAGVAHPRVNRYNTTKSPFKGERS